ncbi:MAG: hypothetical protein Q8N96_08515 [Methylovulum sp.]|nr:hypothetical protein [Methylovulum sp.]
MPFRGISVFDNDAPASLSFAVTPRFIGLLAAVAALQSWGCPLRVHGGQSTGLYLPVTLHPPGKAGNAMGMPLAGVALSSDR